MPSDTLLKERLGAMFVDYYLRFTDQSEMLTVLEPLGMTYPDEEGIVHVSQGGHQYAAWESKTF